MNQVNITSEESPLVSQKTSRVK